MDKRKLSGVRLILTIIVCLFWHICSQADEAIPTLTELYAPQFACNSEASIAKKLDPIYGKVDPSVWTVIANLQVKEIPTTKKSVSVDRRFRGSYLGKAILQCGQKAFGIDVGFIPFIIDVGSKKSGIFYISLDIDTMTKEGLNLKEGEVSFFLTQIQEKPDSDARRNTRPCIITLEDLLSGRRKINLDQLCAGHSPKDRAFTESEIKRLIAEWRKKPRAKKPGALK